jgi:hypothetical protein
MLLIEQPACTEKRQAFVLLHDIAQMYGFVDADAIFCNYPKG